MAGSERGNDSNDSGDVSMKKTLWHLIASTSGGSTRARIIQELSERPRTASQLAERVDYTYNTVRYHLELLEENNIVETGGAEYSRMYHLTDVFGQHRDEFDRIVEEAVEPVDATSKFSTNWQ